MIWQLIQNIFSPEQFIPHGQCYLWKSGLILLHASSDALTAIAYYSIPFLLVYLVRQRKDLPFKSIFWMFGAFIASCGTVHLLEIWTLWHPVYWLLGGIKAITAMLSLYTAVEMYSLIPQALELPSPSKLTVINKTLESEIKERKEIEEALRKSENQYRAIVQDQTELICRFDTEGILSFVNDAYCRYFNTTPEELIGISFYPFLSSFEVVKLQKLLDTLTPEQPVTINEQMIEMFNGEWRCQEWTNRAIFDEDNNLVEYQAVGRDITAIRESERRFQAIFHQTFQFMGLLNPDGTILETNQTFLDFTGLKHEDIVGRYFWQVKWWLAVDDEEHPRNIETKHKLAKKQMRKAIAKAIIGEFVRYEVMVVGQYEQIITIDFSLKPVFNELGQVILLISEGHDITDNKQVEKQLSILNAELETRVTEQTSQLRLITQACKNRIRQQRAVAQITQKALSGKNISLLMDEMVQMVSQILDGEYCKILQLLPDGNSLLLRAGIGWQEGLVGYAIINSGRDTQAGYTLHSSRPVIVQDLRLETRFRAPKLLRDHGIISGVSVIIPGGEKQKPYGILAIHTKMKWWFTQDDVYFLQAVANVLGTAIERQKTLNSLRSSEENFRQIAKNIREVFWISTLDKSESIYVSPTYEDVWGRSITNLKEWRETVINSIHPLDRDSFVLNDEKERRGEFTDDEYRIVRPDGEMRWIWSRAFPVRNRAGEIYRTAGIFEDITERKQMELALFQEKELAEITLKSIGDGVITTDEKGYVDYINPIAEKLTGWELSAAKGLPLAEIFQIFDEQDRTPMESPVDIVFRERLIVELGNHTILVARDGQEYAIEDSAAPIKTEDDEILGAVLVFRDVTDKRKLRNQIFWQAQHDSLTGLLNRREFEKFLENSLEEVNQYNQVHTLAYIDLDRFKIVNDTCGHKAGDELLRQVTLLLQSQCRQADILARIGGDEFALLLLQCDMNNAQRVAQKLIDSIQDYRFVWEDKTFNIGVSIGMITLSQENLSQAGVINDVNWLLSAADAACYIAKNRGRNRFHVYESDDSDLKQQKNTVHWVTKIHQACEQNLFCLYYQPIVPLQNSHLSNCYYEILLRLRDEKDKLIPPMAFLPAAERYNMMPMIDRWVIQNFFSYLSQLKGHLQPSFENLDHERLFRESDTNKTDTIYAINISGETVNDEEFVNFLQAQLARFNISPQMICFEITETVAIANLSQAAKLIRKLKDLGCCFALDDFGSGVSSFTYLKNLPVDYLKIDGSFVKDIVSDPLDYAIVEGMNRIGHVMGLKTIAEFVSNHAILEKIKTIGVDYGQGYGIGYPQPLDLPE
ncbi:MAG: EAL domain-containing protein [Okeania sp. SIO3B5]|uniref:EAL domain-containing protein n=1 Tax=Okeania sp. SIO3B5 TaxID=2607811 RepID=UPI00140121A9|nr:EAL domain-containing protein [Okeania sp. SIO3B5]NEO54543.1 EAL domain-containing protein [Okeania sp. SIO3B5]